MDWLTTSTLLAQMRDGQDVAWQVFVARFRPVILHIALASGLADDEAEDVAQDALKTFSVGLREGRYVRDKGRLSHWLFGIVRNTVRAHRRQASHAPPTESLGDDAGSDLPDVLTRHDLWEREWERVLLALCEAHVRDEVAPTTWEAYERVVKRDERAERVAAELGLTANAVYIAKHRVVARIRALLDDCDRTAEP